jgi:hypothetical protein
VKAASFFNARSVSTLFYRSKRFYIGLTLSLYGGNVQFGNFHSEFAHTVIKNGDGGREQKKYSKTGSLASLDIHVEAVQIS